MSRLSRTLAPAALIALIAGAATGQFIVESTPAAPAAPTAASDAAAPSGSAQSGSVQTIIQIENGKRAELRLEDGVIVMARLDGQDWPTTRITREPDAILLLGDNGAVVHRFSVVMTPPPPTPTLPATTVRPGVRILDRAVPVAPAAPAAPRIAATQAVQTPPPVMLGINFSEPGDALRAQLGLGSTPAILVDAVMDGLPAAQAGLNRHDIIVSINGSEGASGEILLGTLRNAKPDETLVLTLRRGGETKRVDVKLAPRESARLGGSAIVIRQEDSPAGDDLESRLEALIQRYANDPQNQQILDELQTLTTERAKRLAGELADQARQLSAQITVEGIEGLEAMQAEMQVKVEEAMRHAGRQMLELRDGRVFVRSGEAAGRTLEELRDELALRNSPAADARFEDRIRAMEARMEAVERSFEARMDRLSALMERMADRLEADRERKE